MPARRRFGSIGDRETDTVDRDGGSRVASAAFAARHVEIRAEFGDDEPATSALGKHVARKPRHENEAAVPYMRYRRAAVPINERINAARRMPHDDCPIICESALSFSVDRAPTLT